MVNRQMLEGRWHEIRGGLRERWGQLNEDELDQFQGDAEQLVGLIQRRTGESREDVERYLDEMAGGRGQVTEAARQYGQQAAEKARQYGQQAAEKLRVRSQEMNEQMRARYADAEAMVHERPAQSLAAAFGVGMVAGLLVGLMLRSD